MRSKHLLLMLLLALCAPWVAMAQKALPYSYGFEDNNLSTDGWSAMITSSSSGISTDAKHSGSYGFKFYYSEQNAFLVSPELTGTGNGVDMSLYYKESSDYYGDEQFYVTYTTDATNNDPTTYTQLGSIVTASTDWQQYEGSLPAGVKRVAIKYVYNDCLALYLDDFSFTAVEAYPKPKTITVDAMSSTSASLSWTAPAVTPTNYKYQYKAASSSTWSSEVTVTTTSASISGLTAGTDYDFRVKATYSGNSSDYATATFTTLTPKAIPYAYGFEDAGETTPDIDNIWTVKAVDDYTMAMSNTYYGSEMARTGDYFFAMSSYNTENTPSQYLISPQLGGIENGLHVEFYYIKGGSGEEHFKVGYSTTDNAIGSFTWSTEYDVTAEYQRFSANYPAETKFFAVQYTSDYQYFLFLDDFLFEESASCVEPGDVVVDNITTTGASINWTPVGSETAWDIYVTDDATDVPDDATTPTVANTSTKPYPLTSLTPATTYHVYVRAKCTENSVWSVPANFNTECEGMPLPYSYGFENDALPVCYSIINANTSYNSVSISTTAPYSGTKHLNMYRGSSEGLQIVVLPEVDDSYALNEYEIAFYAKLAGTYTDYRTLTVGVMTDPEDATTFVQVGEAITPTTTYAQYKVRLNTYTGSGHYIAIKHAQTQGYYSYGNTYIDDLNVTALPSCFEPSDLTVTAESAHGATFGWTAGGSETEWHLYISEANTAPADDIPLSKVTVATTNPYTLTAGLDPETDYYVWVRANCGGTDGYSVWVGPETFTTIAACLAPTGLAANNATNHTADLSWTGTSESYKVSYRTAAYISTPVLNEAFDSSTLPTDWTRSSTTLTDDVLNGTTTINTISSGWYNTSYGLGAYNWKMNIFNTSKYWLITPSTTLGSNNMLNFDAAITAYNSNNAPSASNMPDANSRFVVLITTDNAATWTILREWNNTGSADVLNNISNTGNNFSIDLSSYDGETVKIAFYGGQTASGPDCDLHIDNVMIGEAVAAGTWTTKTTDASPYQVTGLLAETKYEAKVQGNCGDEGMSAETASIFFTTDIPCPAPTGLTASNATSSSFDLSWTNGGSEDWIVAYKTATDTDFTEVNVEMADVTEEEGLITYTLGSLEETTEYTVKVRDNCEASIIGDGMSEWTTEVVYSTVAACSALNPVVSNITHHTATVNWDGESASGFTVKYRTSGAINPDDTVLEEGFEHDGAMPTDWTHIGNGSLAISNTSSRVHTGSYSLRFSGATSDNVVVLPELGVEANTMLISFWSLAESSTSSGTFQVGYVTDATDASTFHEVGNYKAKDQLEYTHVENVSLASAPAGARIAFRHTSAATNYWWWIDDVVIGAPAGTGTWQDQTATTTSANLTGLTAGTNYDVKVVPNCDETKESETVQFTTVSGDIKWFITEGNWGTAANWMDNEMPTITDNAELRANATITGDAAAKKITINSGKTLTIEGNGSLQTDNTVTATVKKTINAYPTEGKAGYYLIGNPLSSDVSYSTYSTPNTTSVGLVTSTSNYDLYRWTTSSTENYLEWRNYKSSTFSLSNGTGYLYANAANVELTFTGTVKANNVDVTKNPSFTTTGTLPEFNGWNLYANPFVCNAYITSVDENESETPMAFYKMNAAGNNYAAATGAIAPMEGVFVQATKEGQSFKFSRTAPAVTNPGQLNINLTQNTNTRDAVAETDNAIIRFDGGMGLEKFSFREGSSKVFIPQEGKDYAVVSAEAQGEMPVSFKAEKNGSYTLSFSNENVEFGYLHLIDNMTGEDVNLLETPSYSFEAKTTDYASRFKLVFSTGNGVNEESFAFISDGNIILNGEGMLQVVDVMGRIMMQEENATSVSTNGMTPGVYVLRLINGDNVRTQKIVVK